MRGGGKAAGLRHDLNIAFVRFQYFFGQIDAQADPMLDVPSFLGCKYKIPRDVILLHWCYGGTTVEEERSFWISDLKFYTEITKQPR